MSEGLEIVIGLMVFGGFPWMAYKVQEFYRRNK